MSGRPYTDAERQTIHELYPTTPSREIAARIGRSRSSILNQAFNAGLKKSSRHADGTYDRVRKLHADGLPDRVIAQRIGLSHDQVKNIRRVRLHLPLIPDIEGKRRAVRVQMERLGIRLGDLRALGHRRFARDRGWPEDLSPRAVQILEILALAGRPLDRWEIARRIGWNVKRSEGLNGQRSLLSNSRPGGSYPAELLNRGLIVSLVRAKKVAGKGRNRNLYTLSPAALEILINRVKEKPCERTRR